MANRKKGIGPKPAKPDVVRPAVIETTFEARTSRFARVRISNFVLAAVYMVQGIALVVFMHAASLPVTLGYMVRDPLQSAAQGSTVLTPATHTWFTLSVTWLVALVLWVAALGHLLAATSLQRRYESDLEQRTNRLRWWAQGVSLSLLFLTMGLLAGVQDVAVLAALVATVFAVHLGGLLIEKPDAAVWPLRKLHVAVGLILALLPWAIITQYLLAAVVYGTAPAAHVWVAYAVTTGLLIAYSGNFVLRHRAVGKWADQLFGEQIYLGIGLVTLSAFAWLAVCGF